MTIRKMVAMAALAGVMGLMFAGNSSAAQGASTALNAQATPVVQLSSNTVLRGQCGGSVGNWQGYINNLAAFGAVQQAANVNRYAGYSPMDGSFTQWARERVIVTRLAAPVVIDNYGCNARGLFYAGKKHLSKGWPVLVALPNQYEKKDIRLKPTRGYKAKVISVRFVGQATCTNPGKATVKVVIYVKVKAKPKPKPAPKPKPKPKPPTVQPGSCNVNNSPGAVVCSTFYIIVTCGGVQVQINGSTKGEAIAKAEQYVQNNCNVNLPPQQPPPVVPPVVPPAPLENPKPAPSCLAKAHLQTGGDDFLWCEAVVPNRATLSGWRVEKVSGPADASVSGLVPVGIRWDGTPCPPGSQCFRAQMFAGRTTGDLVMKFTIFATFPTGPTTFGDVTVSVPIKEEVGF